MLPSHTCGRVERPSTPRRPNWPGPVTESLPVSLSDSEGPDFCTRVGRLFKLSQALWPVVATGCFSCRLGLILRRNGNHAPWECIPGALQIRDVLPGTSVLRRTKKLRLGGDPVKRSLYHFFFYFVRSLVLFVARVCRNNGFDSLRLLNSLNCTNKQKAILVTENSTRVTRQK